MFFVHVFIDCGDVDQISRIGVVYLEFILDLVAKSRVDFCHGYILSETQFVKIMLFNFVGRIDQNQLSSSNCHLPLVETWLLSGRRFDLTQQKRSESGNFNNNNFVKALYEEDKGMEV